MAVPSRVGAARRTVGEAREVLDGELEAPRNDGLFTGLRPVGFGFGARLVEEPKKLPAEAGFAFLEELLLLAGCLGFFCADFFPLVRRLLFGLSESESESVGSMDIASSSSSSESSSFNSNSSSV